jgi:hypothetical protein
VAEFVVELVVELVPGPAATRLVGVATLDHEPLDNAVEGHVVVQWLFDRLAVVLPCLLACRKPDEVFNCSRRALVVEFDLDVASIGV